MVNSTLFQATPSAAAADEDKQLFASRNSSSCIKKACDIFSKARMNGNLGSPPSGIVKTNL